MKPILLISLLCIASCKTWDGDDKEMFYQSCMDDAKGWAGSEANAKTYCDCVMEKVMKKFPNESDALEHIDSVINDPEIRNCKKTIGK
ncbi:MAG: hypothetical protein P4L41_15350 [Flavipsychrobacter sp.]|nr:hypothetical protein [Flavipsychrobacter sp.]